MSPSEVDLPAMSEILAKAKAEQRIPLSWWVSPDAFASIGKQIPECAKEQRLFGYPLIIRDNPGFIEHEAFVCGWGLETTR
jgi:hypothetical protein